MLRRRFNERQVGHAGTLDPDATGVLLVGIGRATRLLRFLTDLGKTYSGEVVFGTTTDSLDSTGVVTGTFDMSGLSESKVREVVQRHLTGAIEQIPPMVSAVKVDGRKLYELAREGVEIERAPRPVVIHRFDVAATSDPLVYSIEVQCSKGTYIRTLAADLGTALGGGAHLRNLRRTSVGPFTLDEALALEAVAPDRVLPMVAAVRHLSSTTVGGEMADAVAVGKVLEADELELAGEGPWAVLGPDGALLAVYESFRGTTVKPSLVIPPLAEVPADPDPATGA